MLPSFLYFSGLALCSLSQCGWSDEEAAAQEVPARLSSMEGVLGKKGSDTGMCRHSERPTWRKPLPLKRSSLQPSFTPPCLEDTQRSASRVCAWLTWKEDGWPFSWPGQVLDGAGHCPEELSVTTRDASTWKSPSPSWGEIQRDSFSQLCPLLLHPGFGEPTTEEHRTWIPWSWAPSCEREGRAQAWGKRHVSEACGRQGSESLRLKVTIAFTRLIVNWSSRFKLLHSQH